MVGEGESEYSTDSVRGREEGRALLVALLHGSPADGARGRRRSHSLSPGSCDILQCYGTCVFVRVVCFLVSLSIVTGAV